MQAKQHINHLIDEDSFYLRQHAHNPVNWYPWGEEAFLKAKKENKLIFLSIGYSTCHWCHVMEKESFEDKDVADILNKYYVSIKVDREEMPDIDRYYQDIFRIINKRGGGWPLTLVLTPDRKVFFSATYIPKYPKYNSQGLIELLRYFINLKEKNYQKILSIANEIEKLYALTQKDINTSKSVDIKLLNQFILGLKKNYDYDNYGIGIAPKFPHASTIKAMLYIYLLNNDKDILSLAKNMLKAMAKGGINDQIEGGFYRYSVDEEWKIPHFEKMLYTNSELIEDYVLAYNITKDNYFKDIAIMTTEFILKRFMEDNLFFSASDADSKNPKTNEIEEGFYYTYTYKEVKDALKKANIDNYKQILEYFDITRFGNFENNLSNPYIYEIEPKPKNLEFAKEILLEIRKNKPYPFIDKKILTSWNSMMISSLFKMGYIDKKYKNIAKQSIDSLIKHLYVDDILYHQIVIGKNVKIEANLEDYAFLISSLIDAYESSFEKKYLDLANRLTKKSISKFYKQDNFYSSLTPFAIKADFEDNAYISFLSVMVDNLLKLSSMEQDLSYFNIAKNIIEKNISFIERYPSAFAGAILNIISLNKEYITIKSTKENLLKIDKNLFKYPNLILLKEDNIDSFLACGYSSCLANSKKIDEIVLLINKN